MTQAALSLAPRPGSNLCITHPAWPEEAQQRGDSSCSHTLPTSMEHLHCPSQAPRALAAAEQPYLLGPERTCRASCQTSSGTR